MSKYYKAEDVIRAFGEWFAFSETVEDIVANLPTIEASEDCISREGLLKSFGLSEKTRKYGGDHSGYNTMMLYEIQDYIEDAPSVVPSRAEGEWIYIDEPIMGNPYGRYRCSECEFEKPHKTAFCPNCGAKMGGVEE